MKIFAGLGNIGREYEGTRHNIGFEVVRKLEPQLGRSTGWKAGKGDYYMAKGMYHGEDILLIQPTTYMNLSGRAVVSAIQFYKLELPDLVVITDDIAIPLGTLRLRLRGSDGGHNGLASIIYELGTDEFARLRCGVGANFRRGEQVKYVLSKFDTSEWSLVDEMIDRAARSCQRIIQDGIEKAMNFVNADASV